MHRFFGLLPFNRKNQFKATLQAANTVAFFVALGNGCFTSRSNWFESGIPSMLLHLYSAYALQPNAGSIEGVFSTVSNAFCLGGVLAGATTGTGNAEFLEQFLRMLLLSTNAVEGLLGEHQPATTAPKIN